MNDAPVAIDVVDTKALQLTDSKTGAVELEANIDLRVCAITENAVPSARNVARTLA